MNFGDFNHGPFDAQAYIESLSEQFGYDYTLETYHQLPQFFGHKGEDPCLHLDRFEAVCGVCNDVRMSETLRCLFFPLSLQSVAGDWCYAVSDWVYIWKQLRQAFIEKFLPIHQTFTHGFQVKNFYREKGEVFSKSWERFNNLLETFPSHGLELGDILAIFYNALPRVLHQAFDRALGGEFLDLTPSEAWSFLQFFYEHTRPQGRFEPSYESQALESHTNPFSHAPTSLDPYDPSFGSSVCVEPDYSNFACPNLVPLTEGQSEEPWDCWPNEPKDTQTMPTEDLLHQLMQQQLDLDNLNQGLNDLNEQISRLTQLMSTNPSPAQTELLTSDTTIGTEWDNCPNYTGDNMGNEHLPSFPLDSPIQDSSLPLTESQRDMESFPTTKLDTQPTPTTSDLIESPLTPIEHLNVTWPEEHIIESVDPSSLHYTPEVESGAHLSPHDLAPSESLTKGIVSDYHEIDHHWGEVVDIGGEYIDFLGIEGLIKPAMSMSLHALWLLPRFHEPHLAFHPSACFTPEERPPSVLCRPEENILYLKPFVNAWDGVGVG